MSNPAQDIPGFLLAPQQEQPLLLPRDVAVTQAVVVLADGVSQSRLRASLEDLVARHEILRTTFVRLAGVRVPRQVIWDELPPAWTVCDLADSGGFEASLEALIREEAEGVDPEEGPVVRAALGTSPTHERALVLTASAACLDAASMALLLREVGRICRGGEMSEDPLQYADYSAWRRLLLEEGESEAESARSWWDESAERRPSALLFGAPGEGTAAAERLRLTLSAQEVAAVNAAAESSGVTEALFLEACTHALVARLSGETELVLSALADGRAEPELAEALGPYAQLVPIRSRIGPDTTVAELIDQVRRARSDALRWQNYASSEQLRLSGRAPIAFSYHEVADTDDAAVLGRLDRLATRMGSVGIEFVAHRRHADLTCELAYDPTAYNASDAEQIADCFVTLALSAADDPRKPVASLRLLDGAGRTQALALADGGGGVTPEKLIHRVFEEHAAAVPASLAVTDGTERMSYGELNASANRLAHRLRGLGVGRGQAVALCLDRSPAAMVGLLGILKAGAAFVPLNFEHPPSRLAHQVKEAEAVALVTQEHLLERLPAFSSHVVCLDRIDAELAAEPADNPETVNEGGDVAYIMYTSGSTGLPKGVAVTHGNVANYSARLLDRLGADGARLQFAVVSALSTDLGYTSIFPPLVSGGSIHLVDPDVVMDAHAFASYTRAAGIDVLKITPSLLAALLAGGEAVLPRRWLVCGGEAFRYELLEQIRAHSPECRVLNHYGPTETTIGTCVYEVTSDHARPSASVPIGRPLENTQAYVVDAEGQPLPPGAAGELWIGGAGVARGYVNRPEETAERFCVDPFSAVAGARIYRTGDRARFLPDRNIEFLGRVDDQLKIRGFRIEPAEIETTLLRHPAVRQAAVVAKGDRDDLRLTAYVVGSPHPDIEQLRSFVAEWLPEYMVPSILAIDALPLTPSGKVDRNALVDQAGSGLSEQEYVMPRSELEREIAEVWQEVLGIDRVGVTDDFFALGGHSLHAMQMMNRIHNRHGDIPLRSFFAAPTVAGLATVVAERNAALGDGS